MRLVSLPGVFRPISDSWLLARALEGELDAPGARVLDICTGSGVLTISAARRGADATAVDVSRRTVATVRANALLNGVPVRALRGHLFEPVAGERFDVIVSNPPYVPSPDRDVPRRGASRAWAAGHDGRLVLDEICRSAGAHLRPGGVVLLTHSSLIDEQATLDLLAEGGLDAEVVVRERGPLGPLMREQQRLGTVPAHVDHEDVVIVRATAGPLPGAGAGTPGASAALHRGNA